MEMNKTIMEMVYRPIMFAVICGLFTATFTTLLVVFGGHFVKSMAMIALFLAAVGQFVSQETEQRGEYAQKTYFVALVATRVSLVLYLIALAAFVYGA